MRLEEKAHTLQCALCRRGLVTAYDVFHPPAAFGLAPVCFGSVRGYLYSAGTRRSRGVLELAGELPADSGGQRKMVAFAPVCEVGDLVEAEGVFYRIVSLREIGAICTVLVMEVYPYERKA